jgi:hypothetical protein
MKPCTFFQCRYKKEAEDTEAFGAGGGEVGGPFDASCVSAGFSHPQDAPGACHAASDQDGKPCQWCSTDDGAFGLCFNEDQAARASSLLRCDGGSIGVAGIAAAVE